MVLLETVNGSFMITLNETAFDCDIFDLYKARVIIKGGCQCNGAHSNQTLYSQLISTPAPPCASSPTPAPTSSSNAGSQPTGRFVGKKASVGILATVTVGLLICLGIFRIQKRGVKRASWNGMQVDKKYSNDVPAELDLDKITTRSLVKVERHGSC